MPDTSADHESPTIICDGKQKDGTSCLSELTTGHHFCSKCGKEAPLTRTGMDKQKKRLRKENRHLEKFGNAPESSKKVILEEKNTAIKSDISLPPAVAPSENAHNKPSKNGSFVFGIEEKKECNESQRSVDLFSSVIDVKSTNATKVLY